ncbi:MAG: hypothetical protein GEV03_14590 [Streptosporangiales bacterium]|nr:hypothetical protein [Streptosporangiales bacterium]
MPDFLARPEAIDAFANQVGGLEDDTGTAKNYVHQHLSIDYGDARMFFTVAQACNDVKDAVVSSLNRLGTICNASAQELHKSAKMYRTTDKEEAARLDKTYTYEEADSTHE